MTTQKSSLHDCDLLDPSIPPPFTPAEEKAMPFLSTWRDNPIFCAIYQQKKRSKPKWNEFQILYLIFIFIILLPILYFTYFVKQFSFISDNTVNELLIIFSLLGTTTFLVFYYSKRNFNTSATSAENIFFHFFSNDSYLSFLCIPNFKRHFAEAFFLESYGLHKILIVYFFSLFIPMFTISTGFQYHSRNLAEGTINFLPITLVLYILALIPFLPRIKQLCFSLFILGGDRHALFLTSKSHSKEQRSFINEIFKSNESTEILKLVIYLNFPYFAILFFRIIIHTLYLFTLPDDFVINISDFSLDGVLIFTELTTIILLLACYKIVMAILPKPETNINKTFKTSVRKAVRLFDVNIQLNSGEMLIDDPETEKLIKLILRGKKYKK